MKGSPNLNGVFNIFRLIIVFTVLVAASSSATVPEDDVRCLKGVKNSLIDPDGKLSLWTFSNDSVGFMCNFVGVTCWNDRENRLINLELREMMLSGSIPDSLMYCGSLQVLDLSSNNLSGPIPSEICTWLPFFGGVLETTTSGLRRAMILGLRNLNFLANLTIVVAQTLLPENAISIIEKPEKNYMELGRRRRGEREGDTV